MTWPNTRRKQKREKLAQEQAENAKDDLRPPETAENSATGLLSGQNDGSTGHPKPPFAWLLEQMALDPAARRIQASLAAAGVQELRDEAGIEKIRRALWFWSIEVIAALVADADAYIIEPGLLPIPFCRRDEGEPVSETFKRLRRGFLFGAQMKPAHLALTRRVAIEWITLTPGWNLTASSIYPRRQHDASSRWALFSGMRDGEQITEWACEPDGCFVPKLVQSGDGQQWFWVWNQEEL